MGKVLVSLNFFSHSNLFIEKGSEFGVEMEELCGGARILYLFNEVIWITLYYHDVSVVADLIHLGFCKKINICESI